VNSAALQILVSTLHEVVDNAKFPRGGPIVLYLLICLGYPRIGAPLRRIQLAVSHEQRAFLDDRRQYVGDGPAQFFAGRAETESS
jgi:hypothetical protein